MPTRATIDGFHLELPRISRRIYSVSNRKGLTRQLRNLGNLYFVTGYAAVHTRRLVQSDTMSLDFTAVG